MRLGIDGRLLYLRVYLLCVLLAVVIVLHLPYCIYFGLLRTSLLTDAVSGTDPEIDHRGGWLRFEVGSFILP